MSIRSRHFLTLLPLAFWAAAPASAEVRALLVGVSDYHHLDIDLRGPRNDVRLMAETLVTRGATPAAIRVLTTPGTTLAAGLAPAADPTRAAILEALAALAAEAEPGDTVVFYYSGHGSLAPDTSGDEPDGFDQILLPSDVKGWSGAKGLVENAILDDELQLHLQAILDRGAEVVGILDACHSATGFRDLGGEGVARYVAPSVLGLPEALAETAETGQPAAALSGTFTFLYSSQQDQRSFEYPLGDKADPDNWYGDFTRNLVAALVSVESLTWAQALAASADGLRQEQARQTPDGEGTGLGQAVFGGAPVSARLRVEGGKLMQGLLAGVNAGAEVELFDAAAGGASLGFARVAQVSPTDAELAVDAPLPATAYAEIISPGLPAPLRLGPPVVADGGDYSAALAILQTLRADDAVDGVVWSDDGYDLGLVLIGDEIVVTGRDGQLDPAGAGASPRIAAAAGADAILGFVERAARLHRLDQALGMAQAAKRGFGIAGVGLSIKPELLAVAASDGNCTETEAAPIALADGAAVSHCDQVWLTLANSSKTAQDVTVLYVDRDMRISPIWPEQGLSNRVGFGAEVEIGMRIETGDRPVGTEEIIIIAVPARDGAPRTVLTALAEPGAARAAGPTAPLADWLEAAISPEGQSRSFRPGAKPDPLKVTRIRLTLSGKEGG